MSKHFQKLENLFLESPLNKTLESEIKIDEGFAEIKFTRKDFMHNETYHIHPAYNFMALESAAFFAANSLIEDVSIFSKSFEVIYLKNSRSINYVAKARFLEKSMGNYIISSELYDDNTNLISKAKAVYRRSKLSLNNIKNYE